MRSRWFIAAATVGLLALPGAAQAGFSSDAIPISDVVENASTSRIATSPSGDALISWTTFESPRNVIRIRRLRPDGTLGPILSIGDPANNNTTQAAFAFIPDGRAIVVFADRTPGAMQTRLRAQVIETNDTIGPDFFVRNAGTMSDAGELSVTPSAIGPSVLANWHNFASPPGPFRHIEARQVNADTTVGALLDQAGPDAGATGVIGAPDAAGGTLIAWRVGPTSIKSRFLPANPTAATMGAVQTPVSDSTAQPQLSSDGGANFHLISRESSAAMTSSLEHHTLAPDGSAGTELNLDPSGPTNVSAAYRIATNAANRSLVGWSRSDGTSEVAKARFVGSNGEPEADTFTAPDPAGNQQVTGVGIGGSGAGAVAWQFNLALDSPILGRIIPTSGPPPAPVALSSGPSASSSQLAIAPNDVGVVAWVEGASGARTVLARQILPPPTCTDTSGTSVRGRAASIPLPCSGLQLRAAEIVTPPAHGTLGAPDGGSQSVVYTPESGYEGPDSFTWRGRNAGGPATTTQTAMLSADGRAPRFLGSLAFRNRTFAAASQGDSAQGAQRRRRPPIGTRVSFRLDQAANVRFTVTRARPGRRSGRRCVKPTRRNRRARRCVRHVLQRGSFTLPGASGQTRFRFTGRLRGRKLRVGRYRLVAVATDAVGNASPRKRAPFRIVRR